MVCPFVLWEKENVDPLKDQRYMNFGKYRGGETSGRVRVVGAGKREKNLTRSRIRSFGGESSWIWGGKGGPDTKGHQAKAELKGVEFESEGRTNDCLSPKLQCGRLCLGRRGEMRGTGRIESHENAATASRKGEGA